MKCTSVRVGAAQGGRRHQQNTDSSPPPAPPPTPPTPPTPARHVTPRTFSWKTYDRYHHLEIAHRIEAALKKIMQISILKREKRFILILARSS
ncbi:hypothetical protein EVAR_8421_1 [Eumeta japonica]|uniref:Uncharacterized protein n=1 Tax=Eumeta variegata TaxID=151549 RepID=A0A4C1WCN7_EUMVA|nr:hypothetical protein EVAR_8421_1 [Eumeta japonica]